MSQLFRKIGEGIIRFFDTPKLRRRIVQQQVKIDLLEYRCKILEEIINSKLIGGKK